MTNSRSSLPVPGSRLPTRAASPAPEQRVHPANTTPGKPQTPSQKREIPRITGSSLQDPTSRIRRPVPVLPKSSNIIGDRPEVMTSSPVTSSSIENTNCDEGDISDKPCGEYSQYNGPQLVEPCVGNALFHVLKICGHRVMTQDVQLCGQNCVGSDSPFANKKTRAKLVCTVCISKYVHEHYAAKKNLYLPSLDVLERALGGFRAGWREKRIARMERVWKTDALEEQRALEKLGRRCEPVSTDPDEEKLVEDEERATPEVELSAEHTDLSARTAATIYYVEIQKDRLKVPVAKRPKSRSQLPVASSKAAPGKEAPESQRTRKRTTRITVGPRLSYK
ncbi:hypothetical protein MBLNU13_g08226t1 [Cladosporium sp. NU13]